ncbi:MAG: pilus assembly protein TadG-related protein [Planctomycetaceae bacterium]
MICTHHKPFRSNTWQHRRGNIVVLSAGFLVGLMGLAAFSVDLGYIALTRSQLQVATDSAALSAAWQLGPGLNPGNNPSQETVSTNAKNSAVSVAASNRAGDKQSVYISPSGDMQFGKRSWNGETGGWQDSWGTQQYNLVRVTANRGRGASGAGDAALPLFFARALGHNYANLSVSSTAALLPGAGFQINGANSTTCELLPIAYDEPSWNALMAGAGPDNYSYHNGGVSSGSGDGIREIDLYPYGNQSLTPGNRGTVDLGSPNNSTADLSRQILYGVNAQDLAYFGGKIEVPQGGYLSLNGDTGISAGIKDELTAIIGQPRAIPIFRDVSGPGNNAQFEIVKFVGIRIMYVKLTGGNKTVVAQPAPLISSSVISGNSANVTDFIWTTPKLVQ